MRRYEFFVFAFLLFFSAWIARATIFGTVRGIVHDPQHRPIPGATVVLKSSTSDWSQTAQTNDDGEFFFQSVAIGDYTITISKGGFESSVQPLTIVSSASPVFHVVLNIASVQQTAVVHGESQTVATIDSVTPTTLVDRQDIQLTPGADRSNALQMITDYTPAAYVTHDMLHVRGGHQFEWLIDGVTIPNTNIASNLGPQIDPKDIDYLEVQRGSYDADYGDRTYGVFNIVPRTGFERENEGELILTFGNWYQTNEQVNFGGHTERFAYYASLNGDRSNYGLQPPVGDVVHDAENGFGGFASFIFNPSSQNQFRLVTSLRRDYYQIPIDPDPNSWGNQIFPSYAFRDADVETDGYVAFTWLHTINSNATLTVSPFYHYNKASYNASPNDQFVITNVDQAANYAGAQASINYNFWRNNLTAGVYGFAQREANFYDNTFVPPCPPGGCNNFGPSSAAVLGGVAEGYLSDKFKITSWLNIIAGVRYSHFDAPAVNGLLAGVVENATDPRVGIAVRVPKLNWVFRAFYGDYYQAPPLSATTGALNSIASDQGFVFAPIRGERDEEHQFGVTIPFRGWALDADTFQTRAKNWLDHSNIGESNLFWPITWDGALIQTWELTLRSPRVWHRGQFHLAFANQIAQSRGPFTGGLVCPTPAPPDCEPSPGYGAADHDQRNTLNLGYNGVLPWHTFASMNMYYGSGFSNGLPFPASPYPNDYLPAHTSFDASLGKTFRENYTVSVTALNIGNRRVLLDNSLTFGGFHYNDPRQIYVEFRWHFHY